MLCYVMLGYIDIIKHIVMSPFLICCIALVEKKTHFYAMLCYVIFYVVLCRSYFAKFDICITLNLQNSAKYVKSTRNFSKKK